MDRILLHFRVLALMINDAIVFVDAVCLFIMIVFIVITKGTSGSSILGSDNKARGVNTFELTDPTIPFNGGNVFIKGNHTTTSSSTPGVRLRTSTVLVQ